MSDQTSIRSGSYVDSSAESYAADVAAITQAVNAAYTATGRGQFQSREFITVQAPLAGHGSDTVGSAGAPADLTFEGPVSA